MRQEIFVVTLTVMCLAIYGISFAADTNEAKDSMKCGMDEEYQG